MSLLCLNAGVMDYNFVRMQTDKWVQDILNVNAVHVAFMTKVFIKRLVERNLDSSAILVTGSGLRALPIPGINVYCGTKKFVYYMCKALGEDLKRQKKKVRVVCFDSGPVSTNMTEHNKGMIGPEVASERALSALGKTLELNSFETQGFFGGELM